MAEAAESRVRTVLITFFPMFIATLSLLTSIYNGWLNARFVDIIQRNVGRVEYMRTCKEAIDAYFLVKVRISALSAAGDRAGAASPEQNEAAIAIAKFGALGTYLANLRDDRIRQQYTQLTDELRTIAAQARTIPPADLDRRFAAADRLFATMNDDCIRSAQEAPM